MLRCLKRDGHRALIFSQMTSMLDLIQEYLDLSGQAYCRIDGSTPLEQRAEQMLIYQEHDDAPFWFLLSTRAAGLGLNLSAADTVIIYDSDWNPQQDLQAQDRAHRIGQTRPVAVYRLLTENSIEVRVMEKASEKRKLERVVIGRGNFKRAGISTLKEMDAEELEQLLKDDFEIRKHATGGITKQELSLIMNRKALFSSKKLPLKGKGYEVIDNSCTSLVGTLE